MHTEVPGRPVRVLRHNSWPAYRKTVLEARRHRDCQRLLAAILIGPLAATRKTSWPSQIVTGFADRRAVRLLRLPILGYRSSGQGRCLSAQNVKFWRTVIAADERAAYGGVGILHTVGVVTTLAIDGHEVTLPDPHGGSFNPAGDFDRLLPLARALPLLGRVDEHGAVQFTSAELVLLGEEASGLLRYSRWTGAARLDQADRAGGPRQ
jgi:hypothetical protein